MGCQDLKGSWISCVSFGGTLGKIYQPWFCQRSLDHDPARRRHRALVHSGPGDGIGTWDLRSSHM